MATEERHTPSEEQPKLNAVDDGGPQIEQFIENREMYIKALEQTIDALKRENNQFNKNNLDIRSSIDELVAMQRLSNTISTAVEPERIVGTLIELSQQVLPIIEANVFLFDMSEKRLLPLTSHGSDRLVAEAQQHLESGIVDWVFSEKKTVIIPDLSHMMGDGTPQNFVIVPLVLRNKDVGIYLIHTQKPQQEFSNQDMQLLTVLANQAAAGVENWRSYHQLMKANQELKASQAQMMQAAKLVALGELAASIVHEIKNPIQILMMHLDMATKGKPVPNWLDMFNQQVRRLAEITKRLMTFSRKVADDFQIELVDVNKAIEDVVAIVRHDFQNNKVNISTKLATTLPTIPGNANYLQQVFLNLLINARDAMPDGGNVELSTESKGFRVVVHVADTGSGIPKEVIDKIFTPFFTTKEAGKGTGLGLSICSKIIAQHKGEIKVESSPEKGTTFSVSLPVRRTIE
ncbi:MAG TPA: ATP-binding protein [Bacteroidota bacterium]|nr:ATP-binding protein [Bacteroidota bacterium]